MSLMGDAISHAVLPGLAVAFIITQSRAAWPMFLGALVVGIITALLIQAITRYGRVEQGASMGVVFSIFFAAGLILIRKAAGLDGVDLDPECVLYGNILFTPFDTMPLFGAHPPRAAVVLACVLVVDVVFVALFYKELKICAFDPALAAAQGIHPAIMHYALMAVVALTTVASFEAVGSILVIAMLIVPPAAAYLLTDRLSVMIALSLAIGAASAVLGHWLGAFGPIWLGGAQSLNTAGMMTVVCGACFALALLCSPSYGLLRRVYNRIALNLQIASEDILGLLYRFEEIGVRPDQPMRPDEVFAAVGDSWAARWALRRLQRAGDVSAAPGLVLTPKGRTRGAALVRAHRLWEVYLAQHFNLPLDHLHAPAERMEHYLTPALREQLETQLTSPDVDPHGKAIPREDDAS